jgi:hypothetical protein
VGLGLRAKGVPSEVFSDVVSLRVSFGGAVFRAARTTAMKAFGLSPEGDIDGVDSALRSSLALLSR